MTATEAILLIIGTLLAFAGGTFMGYIAKSPTLWMPALTFTMIYLSGILVGMAID